MINCKFVFCILVILYFPCFTFIIFLLIFNTLKRFYLLNTLILINKVGTILNIGFILIGIYITINYFHEFLYFIKIDNINIIDNCSDYSVNCSIKSN